MDTPQPTEEEARQEAADTATDGYRDTNEFEFDHPDQKSERHPDTEEHKIGHSRRRDGGTDMPRNAHGSDHQPSFASRLDAGS